VKHLYSEHNPYRAAVLRERIEDGLLPAGVVDERNIEEIPDEDFLGYAQVHLFAGIGGFPLGMRRASFPEHIRIVDGGFPCQDISNAGKRAGITGARSGLWREMVRCIRVVRPDLVFVENVAALLGRGMGVVLGDLAEIGYDAEGDCISAADVGAPHERQRTFIVGYPERHGLQARKVFNERPRLITGSRWLSEPNVGRVAHGIPKRLDRLAALGDAIVPQCVEEVLRRLKL
jgi:DNA (cytosine-5)-methyltransferase 1